MVESEVSILNLSLSEKLEIIKNNEALIKNEYTKFNLNFEEQDILKELNKEWNHTLFLDFVKSQTKRVTKNLIYLNYTLNSIFDIITSFEVKEQFIKTYVKHLNESNLLVLGVFSNSSDLTMDMIKLLEDVNLDLILIENEYYVLKNHILTNIESIKDDRFLTFNQLKTIDELVLLTKVDKNKEETLVILNKPKKITKNKDNKFLKNVSKVIINLVVILVVIIPFLLLVSITDSDSASFSMQILGIFALYIALRVTNNILKGNAKKNSINRQDEILSKLDYLTPLEVKDFLEEEIEVLVETKKVHKVLEYDTNLDLNKYINDLVAYFKANGLLIKPRMVRTIYSNLTANRINIINNENEIDAKKVYYLLSEFVGANINTLEVNNNMKDSDYLESDRSILNQAIKIARSTKDKINILILDKVNFNKFSENYKNIINHAKSPDTKHVFKTKSLNITIPRNLWFIIIPNSKDTPNLENEVRDSGTFVNLKVEETESSFESNKNDLKMSFYMLNDLIRDSREFYYIEEDIWKKFDRLDEYIKSSINYNVFNNYIIQAVENFTAIYLKDEGDLSECIDDLLSSKILPQISNVKVPKQNGNDESINDLLEDLFEIDNLVNSKAILNKIKETNNI